MGVGGQPDADGIWECTEAWKMSTSSSRRRTLILIPSSLCMAHSHRNFSPKPTERNAAKECFGKNLIRDRGWRQLFLLIYIHGRVVGTARCKRGKFWGLLRVERVDSVASVYVTSLVTEFVKMTRLKFSKDGWAGDSAYVIFNLSSRLRRGLSKDALGKNPPQQMTAL